MLGWRRDALAMGVLGLVWSGCGVEGQFPPMRWLKNDKLRLASTFQDNAVLQWSRPCVWGWVDDVTPDALRQSSVSVTCQAEGCHATTQVASEDGEWRACLPPQPPGGPTLIAIEVHGSGGKKDVLGHIELKNVLFGDVWIASGQSNIHFTVRDLLGCSWRLSYVRGGGEHILLRTH